MNHNSVAFIRSVLIMPPTLNSRNIEKNLDIKCEEWKPAVIATAFCVGGGRSYW